MVTLNMWSNVKSAFDILLLSIGCQNKHIVEAACLLELILIHIKSFIFS